MIWFTVLGIIVFIVYYIARANKRKRLIAMASTELQSRHELENMSIDQARAVVDDLINQRLIFFTEPADNEIQLYVELSPATKEFFLKYKTLRNRLGGFEISSANIQDSDYFHGFISIGHSEDWDVIQKPGNDFVYVAEGSETNESKMVRFPSIYHLINDEARMEKSGKNTGSDPVK